MEVEGGLRYRHKVQHKAWKVLQKMEQASSVSSES